MKKYSLFFAFLAFAAFIAILAACGSGEIVDLSSGSKEANEIYFGEKGIEEFIAGCKNDNSECDEILKIKRSSSASEEPSSSSEEEVSSSSSDTEQSSSSIAPSSSSVRSSSSATPSSSSVRSSSSIAPSSSSVRSSSSIAPSSSSVRSSSSATPSSSSVRSSSSIAPSSSSVASSSNSSVVTGHCHSPSFGNDQPLYCKWPDACHPIDSRYSTADANTEFGIVGCTAGNCTCENLIKNCDNFGYMYTTNNCTGQHVGKKDPNAAILGCCKWNDGKCWTVTESDNSWQWCNNKVIEGSACPSNDGSCP